MLIAPKSKRHLVDGITLRVDNNIITPSKELRDLGSRLDPHLSMHSQATSTVRAGYMHLRTVNKIRKHLTDEACAKLLNATVTSRLDYHNGLLAGSRHNVTQPLQKLQNHAARVLTRTGIWEHISPVLRDLHWLPVRKRADFKLLSHIHCTLHHPAPLYMKEMWRLQRPGRALRSADDEWTLSVPRVHRHEGERSAACHGASLWNTLPSEIRQPMSRDSFKKKLKTYLFTL